MYRDEWGMKMCLLLLVVATEGKRDCFAVTSFGAVKGSKEKSENGKSFCSFRGIPYAAPPVGRLRFKVDIFNATR